MGDDVDHIIPIDDGGHRYYWSNLQTLCKHHHLGLKEKLQTIARAIGRVDLLPEWCSSIEATREALLLKPENFDEEQRRGTFQARDRS